MAFLSGVAANLGSSLVNGGLNSLVAATNQGQLSDEQWLDNLLAQAISDFSFENICLITNFIEDFEYEGRFKEPLKDWKRVVCNNYYYYENKPSLLLESLIKLRQDLSGYLSQTPETRVTRLENNITRIAGMSLLKQTRSLLNLLPTSIASDLHQRLARLETGQKSSSTEQCREQQLDKLLSNAIAQPSYENLQAVKEWLETNTINTNLDLGVLQHLETSLSHLDEDGNGKECLADLITLRQNLRDQLNANSLVTQAAQKAQVIFKKQISLLLQTLLGWVESKIKIPENVRLQVHTLLTRLELGQLSTKAAAQEFAKIFETVEVRVQGFNVSELFQRLFQEVEEEEEEFQPIEEIVPQTPPSPSIPVAEIKNEIEREKNRFIEQTSLFLVFSLAHDLLLPKKNSYFYMSSVRSSMIDEGNNTTPNQRLKETLRAYLQNENVLKRFIAHVLWYLLSKIIPSLVANLCNHHIDNFFKTYISSEETESNNQLFKDIVSNLNRYLVILDQAYRRVSSQTHREEDIPDALTKELDDPSVYRSRSTRSFYARLIRQELNIALGNSLTAKVASFIIGWPLSWILAPKLVEFRDNQFHSFTHSNGYPHGVNLVLLKQLKHLKTSLEGPSLTTNAALKPLPVQDRDDLRSLLKKLLEILKPNIAYTQKELEEALKSTSFKDDLYNKGIEAATDFASNFVQRLSSNHQLEHLFLELMQQANEIYAFDSTQPKRAEEAEVSQEVTGLIGKITDLSTRQFIRDLDLFGKQEQALVNGLITHTKQTIDSLSEISNKIENLRLDGSSQGSLADLIKRVENINSSLIDLSSYPRIEPRHKQILTTYNTRLSTIQRSLGKALEKMQEIVTKQTQLQALKDIKDPLIAISDQILSSEMPLLADLNFVEIRKKLEEQNVFQFPASLTKTYADLQKQAQTLKQATNLLSDPVGQEQAILDWLKARSTYTELRQQAWLIKVQNSLSRATASQAVPAAETSTEVPPSPSKTQNPTVPMTPRRGATEDNSSQILNELIKELTAQKTALKQSVEDLRNTVSDQITLLTTHIDNRERGIKQINDPRNHFERAQQESLKQLETLKVFNTNDLRPITVYNTEIISERQIQRGATSIINLFGSTLITSLTSLLSKKTTYTHGLIPHVLIPILTKK